MHQIWEQGTEGGLHHNLEMKVFSGFIIGRIKPATSINLQLQRKALNRKVYTRCDCNVKVKCIHVRQGDNKK